MKVSAGVFFIVLGFAMGWMSAKLLSPASEALPTLAGPDQQDVYRVLDAGLSPAVGLNEQGRGALGLSSESVGLAKNDPKEFPESKKESLAALLSAGKYTQAVDLLSKARELDEREFAQLRQAVLDFLDGLMTSGQDQAFTELVDAYLADSYDDIEILLMLAEYNKRNSFYFEAVAVFDMADEYAYGVANKTQVAIAFADFLREVDTFLVDRNDWYQLSQVYFQAEIAGLLSADQRNRQAAIYIKNDDLYEGKKILIDLQDEGKLSRQGADVLASLNAGDGVSAASLPMIASGIPLRLVGNQFHIEVGIASDQPSVLLIDTGASMTTLSRSGFDSLRGTIDARELGTRMFSTANGLTKGYVYQLSEFVIGQYRLVNIDIAVLDFDMGGGAQGLLGMNVLGKFKFQLDQEKPQLLLTPR